MYNYNQRQVIIDSVDKTNSNYIQTLCKIVNSNTYVRYTQVTTNYMLYLITRWKRM